MFGRKTVRLLKLPQIGPKFGGLKKEVNSALEILF